MGARNWCWTLNNPNDETEDILRVQLGGDGAVRYAIWQLERGESGTRHLQGYLELTKVMRIAGLKQLFHPFKPHFEKRRGTREQARDYCRKDESSLGGRVELGEWEQQRGRRTDIEDFANAIREGDGDLQLLCKYPGQFLRFGSMVQRARHASHKRVRREMRVIVCSGKTGSGKSHFAWHYRDGDFSRIYKLFQKKPVWFDGYAGEDTLFIDEWEGEPACELLKEICDVWPYTAPVKGGSVLAQWDTVIIATNFIRDQICTHWDEAMIRRVSQWREYDGRDSVTVTEVA